MVKYSVDQAVPKLLNLNQTIYPPHIIDLINMRRKIRREKKKTYLISTVQSGFRKHRGTSDNLIFVTQKLQEGLNRGKKAIGIFFDISKAFDKVWHSGLIYKLIYLRVPMYLIKIIKSFLEDRTFKVKINNFYSDSHPVKCSVPQVPYWGIFYS